MASGREGFRREEQLNDCDLEIDACGVLPVAHVRVGTSQRAGAVPAFAGHRAVFAAVPEID